MLKRLGPLLLAAALLTAGCSAEPIPDSEKILIESSSSPLGREVLGAKAEGRFVTVPEAGVKFRVPRAWTRITPGEQSAIATYARSLGVSAKDIRTVVDKADLFLVGRPGSLIAVTLPSYDPAPTRAQFRSALETDTIDVTSVEKVTTRLGEGLAAYYTQDVAGQTAYGVALVARVGKKAAYITVSTPDSARTRRLVLQVASSLKRS